MMMRAGRGVWRAERGRVVVEWRAERGRVVVEWRAERGRVVVERGRGVRIGVGCRLWRVCMCWGV